MTEQSDQYEGDYVTVARFSNPTEAHLLKETLVASGIEAKLADANFTLANPWMANAVGGVRVLVSASRVAEAKKTIIAFNSGDFELEPQNLTSGDECEDQVQTAKPGLKTYVLYKNTSKTPSILAVKKGFSWSAFFIGPLWFLINGMWLTFFLSLSFAWGTPFVIRSFDNPEIEGSSAAQLLVFVAYFTIWVFSGMVANFLLGEDLKRKGYVVCPSVRARSVGEAIDANRRAST